MGGNESPTKKDVSCPVREVISFIIQEKIKVFHVLMKDFPLHIYYHLKRCITVELFPVPVTRQLK
jgi:hypothetical protein